ncbi:MAG: DinB family protein [Ardenticatenaceae bacterium]|nr:DinB family protein [Ardenticatenaceae bacterium]
MGIDFSRVIAKEIKLSELAEGCTLDDLRTATEESVDYLLRSITDLTDEQITFDPVDEGADDPYAEKSEERHIGWSVAHLIAHVTASSEEGAAFSSLLARGVPASERPRYETPWRDITTKEQCVQRLEESRRMRLAYLDTWPDQPFLDVYREMSPRFEEIVGKMNATGSFLLGLSHEVGHYEQIEEVIAQAKEV